MKIRADEHVSKHIVAAIRNIALSPNWEITSIHEVGDEGTADQHWITKFANDGGEAIISADRDFLKLEPQVNAIFYTGLKVIHLPPRWGQAKGALQAAHLLQWWARIEKALAEMKPRECYRPPWNIKESGALQKLSIDFPKAQKKRKRDRRRSS